MARGVMLLLCAALWLAPAPAQACSCGPAGDPAQARRGAAQVFRGQVVASHETWASALPGSLFRRVPGWLAPDRGVVLDLEVARVWKGPLHARRRVLTGLGGGDCGLGASVGDDLLVYAYEEEGSAFTNICTRTGPFAHAGPDLAVLGVGRAPEPGRAYLMLLVPLAFAAFGLGAALVGARHWRQRGSTGSL